ncbi:protoglobin domain-containing protein [Bradyrhizobium sp. CCBAU 53338]|uniref:protoglobin domain-containing protein n=1 Tax=Bradyrhizobium sp. CCBAU 53338 TaxID=1325111 RepID=UPI00188D4CDE|nr:protoglobin domain-containing protein [Bradyrhizobium sp. CCBAU 53338]
MAEHLFFPPHIARQGGCANDSIWLRCAARDTARREAVMPGRGLMSQIEDRLQLIGLNAAERALLCEHASLVGEALPVVLDRFYKDILSVPRLQRQFRDDAHIHRAKTAQLKHWLMILDGEFDDAYMASAVRIGQAHHRIGLEPRDYIAAYAKLLNALQSEVEDRLSGWRRRSKRRALQDALTRAALLDMDLALSVYISRSMDDQSRTALRDMCEILEADLDSAVSEVLTISNEAAERSESAAQDAKAIAAEAFTVAASSEQATGNVSSVSAATEQLSAAGREIAERAVQTAQLATRAADEIERAGSTVAALNDAANRIQAVTKLISEVAAQTNLLALNATIEAARAGEAGKGFAVVAHEVKALSRKTSEAAEDIAQRIQDICHASQQSIEVIARVGTAVSDIKEVTGAVAAAAEEQEATLQDVARSLTEASQGVAAVSHNVARISGRSTEIETQSNTLSGLVNGTHGRVSELRANLVVSLRSSYAGDRRSQENRRPVSLAAVAQSDGARIDGTVLDLSEGGLRFRAKDGRNELREGSSIVVRTSELGEVRGKIIAIGQPNVHVQFDALSNDRKDAVATYLRNVDSTDEKFVAAARQAAGRISAAFEAALAKGDISEADLFNFEYRPIAGSSPQQFEAPFLTMCDRILPDIQEGILGLDPRVAFCAAVDTNAYLPTHNRKFSQPQRPNDPAWNAANSRNRRFFKDSAGLRAARTTREFLLQTYDRDMGGGAIVTLKEVDAPLRVNGRHWGGLRLAFKA